MFAREFWSMRNSDVRYKPTHKQQEGNVIRQVTFLIFEST